MSFYIHESSYIDNDVTIGENSKIWHFCHVSEGCKIGKNCNIGQNVYIGNNVSIGNNVKVQNNVSIYTGVTLEDAVFCGPSVVFTNDLNPRSVYPKGGRYVPTLIKHGASLGGNSTIVCGNTVGRCAMVAAGSVVTKNVKDYELVMGIPARHYAWICECGKRLNNNLQCECGKKYKEIESGLEEINAI